MNLARKVLDRLNQMEFIPDKVVASAEGGVAICFSRENKYSDLECLNTGEILGVISDRKDRPTAWEVDNSPYSIAQAAIRIREFFNS
jgi:hypothetical protein